MTSSCCDLLRNILNRVPQALTFDHPLGCALWQHNSRVLYTKLLDDNPRMDPLAQS